MSIKSARLIRFLFFGTLVFVLPLDSQKAISATPLDQYVAAPDSNYSFTHDRTEDTGSLFNQPWFQTHYLDMTSQKWRSEVGSDRAIWTHKLTITRANIRVLTPNNPPDTALIIIGGGDRFGDLSPDHGIQSTDSL